MANKTKEDSELRQPDKFITVRTHRRRILGKFVYEPNAYAKVVRMDEAVATLNKSVENHVKYGRFYWEEIK